MRAYYVVVLAVTLIARFSAALPGSKLTFPMRSVLERSAGKGASPNRVLRGHKGPNGDHYTERRLPSITAIDDVFDTTKINSLLKGWETSNTPGDEVFTLLKMTNAADNIFEQPQWKTWANSVATVSKKDPAEAISADLTVHYGAYGLAKMLATAAENPNTKAIAAKVELSSPPGRLFKRLHLNEPGNNIFDNPLLTTWTNYLKMFNDANPNKQTTVLETITKNFDEDGMVKMLLSAKNAESSTASKVKNELVQSWLDFSTPPAKTFSLLQLDKAGDNLLSSPMLVTWVQYMQAFNKVLPRKQTTMIKTFSQSYGDGKLATILEAGKKVPQTETLAKNLQSAQFKQWMVDGKNPDDIYKTVLKLHSTSSPNADIWRAYYKAYDAEFPGKLFSFKP